MSAQRQQLRNQFVERIISGLTRKAIRTVSRYAEEYRIMGPPFPGKWTFDHHPWLKELCDITNELQVGQKAAQMGYTEVALNKAFKWLDIDWVSVLYVLPTKVPDATDFSTARFDTALELSPHLNDLFTDVKNVGHKRAGTASLYVRGSRSRSHLKSIPVSGVILDEVDEMVQANLSLVFERMSGQVDKWVFALSTPTIEKIGINEMYAGTDQRHFMFRCPRCGRSTELVFPDCLVITADSPDDPKIRESYIICKECKGTLDHEAKRFFLKDGFWVPTVENRFKIGHHINQMYSMTVPPWELAALHLKSLSNETDEQEFYNSKLGLPHEVKGARVTDTNIKECEGEFKISQGCTRNVITTMGVDVGKFLHVEIDEWFFYSTPTPSDIHSVTRPRAIHIDKYQNFSELIDLMRRFMINACVIDANPERRKAFEFAEYFHGIVRMCFYGNNLKGSKAISLHDQSEHTMTVDRTAWLDVALGRFKNKRISLPVDMPFEYRQQIKAPVRIYKKDAQGNPVGNYVVGNEDDHYAHARCYAELALPLAASLFSNFDIEALI